MRPKRLVPAFFAAVVMAGLAAPAATAGGSAAPAQRDAGSFRDQVQRHRSTGRLQVRFKDGVGATGRAAALARVSARGQRATVDRRIAALNAAVLSVSSTRAVQDILRSDDRVAYVEAESRYKAFAETPSRELIELGANVVHTHPSGANVGTGKTIAILDSPVSATNADLDGPGKVVVDGDYTTDVPDDPEDPYQTQDFACTAAACPHGTAVANAAAGEIDDAGMVGAAPGATVRSYNVFRRFVYTNPANETETFEMVGASSGDISAGLAAVAADAASDPSIVAANLSLGGPFDSQLIRDAIANLHSVAPQVTIVAAAGNDGTERANFPAGDPFVLSVGATGQIPETQACSTVVAESTPWTVTGFSNRGDVDVVAPGRCVSAWYPTQDEETGAYNNDSTLSKIDGTSFAAPMVAGVVALLAAGPTPVTGDAARAAIIAGAGGTPGISNGVGKADAVQALALAGGSNAYTAMTVERGGQVASNVGRRRVEVIRVQPGAVATTTVPTPTVTSGFGSLAAAAGGAGGTGLSTAFFTFAVPSTAKTGTFSLTAAGGGAGADDTIVVPMKMLDAGDNYEGLPAANNEATSASLTYGSRTAYIRSAALTSGTLSWTYTYNALSTYGADLYVWMPVSNGGTADAAFEPIGQMGQEDIGPYTDELTVGDDPFGYPFTSGRYLLGWLISSEADNSTSAANSKYLMKFTYSGPTITATTPAVASSTSTTGPFGVSWGGTKSVKFDVEYMTKVKSGTSWVSGTWKPWKTGTTSKSAVFGASNLPVKIGQGQTYHFRFKGYDTLGNPTTLLTKYTATPLDDRYAYMGFSTGWTSVNVAGRWMSTVRQTATAGAKVSLSSETSSFSVVGDRCAACGQMKIYLDGVLKATVDTRATSTLTRQVLWTSGALTGGIKSRKITIVNVATAGRPKIVLDGISTLR